MFSFGLLFVYCEIGERVADNFEEINSAFCGMDWYLFPTEARRMMPIILMATRQAVQFKGYGNIPATRGTFKGVIKIEHLKWKRSLIEFDSFADNEFCLLIVHDFPGDSMNIQTAASSSAPGDISVITFLRSLWIITKVKLSTNMLMSAQYSCVV